MSNYLTFDCYGTLLNEATLYDKVAAIASELGVDPQAARIQFTSYQDSADNVHPYLDYTVLLRNNLIHLDYVFGQQHGFEAHFFEVLDANRQLQPFPEVIDTLKTLQQRGYQLILMSNSAWDIMPANLATLQVPVDVWTAEDVHAYKPNLNFFKTVADHYGFTAENHIHLAQGYGTDIVPVSLLPDWRAIWVNRNHETGGAARPWREVSRLDEVLRILV
ncbi:HAD family hydrolase [Secundilactobacillus paracollinoides]|uniref:HAD family hydrolase n=1 Tax=Secundilactobacillus paracollinoides TaxID=240427 RepID=A0A1B2J0V5_9LACO|nr:HAD family hydrolase [Secundilactobacillus paracollinoides]ANZ61943.1 HAD family hydrolase [Secundilactobacillus paracollinoides]ANZ63630.1 HAD family hydrolase [Secundilactobacillus paracollinoides]ANZ67889.1 HAD family hydrolase [Secundilactobacillus paracollinoides]KRL79308.1 HAD superfamily hydrolase [Secundilactobacillus paracollinoides DSM 15502 = JCM 11969]